MALQHELTLVQRIADAPYLTLPLLSELVDLARSSQRKKGDNFKWCQCRHFRDFCTHTWQDDPEVFRW